eukprot:m.330090 g.330090  ORF g.330090 m.330090 type:complete len:193 (+) comp55605_c0_seq7:1007-1585(+)
MRSMMLLGWPGMTSCHLSTGSTMTCAKLLSRKLSSSVDLPAAMLPSIAIVICPAISPALCGVCFRASTCNRKICFAGFSARFHWLHAYTHPPHFCLTAAHNKTQHDGSKSKPLNRGCCTSPPRLALLHTEFRVLLTYGRLLAAGWPKPVDGGGADGDSSQKFDSRPGTRSQPSVPGGMDDGARPTFRFASGV